MNDALRRGDVARRGGRRGPSIGSQARLATVMIGPSDIPCFSMIRHLGGKAIGVMPPDDLELTKPYELAEGNRLTVGPYTADYREGTDLFKMMSRVVTGIADSILEKREHRIKP